MNPPTDWFCRLVGITRNWKTPATPLAALERIKRELAIAEANGASFTLEGSSHEST